MFFPKKKEKTFCLSIQNINTSITALHGSIGLVKSTKNTGQCVLDKCFKCDDWWLWTVVVVSATMWQLPLMQDWCTWTQPKKNTQVFFKSPLKKQ